MLRRKSRAPLRPQSPNQWINDNDPFGTPTLVLLQGVAQNVSPTVYRRVVVARSHCVLQTAPIRRASGDFVGPTEYSRPRRASRRSSGPKQEVENVEPLCRYRRYRLAESAKSCCWRRRTRQFPLHYPKYRRGGMTRMYLRCVALSDCTAHTTKYTRR